MKTAMQMMLDDLISKRNVYENAKMYESVATLETSIILAKHLISIEKDDIMDAYVNGYINWDSEQSAEEFYEENYENK
jgi:hypothetical protein